MQPNNVPYLLVFNSQWHVAWRPSLPRLSCDAYFCARLFSYWSRKCSVSYLVLLLIDHKARRLVPLILKLRDFSVRFFWCWFLLELACIAGLSDLLSVSVFITQLKMETRFRNLGN